MPAGSGPFPVVIVLHGCGGMGINQTIWADRLNDWGYAAFDPRQLWPTRRRLRLCAPCPNPTSVPSDRASDVISAALWLRGQPGVDPDRITVLGVSHGGATAAWVTQAVYEKRYPGLLKASIDYDGTCRNPETYGGAPLLVLAGEADDWGRPALTCRAFGQKLRPDQPFEIYTYPNVVHAFDNPRQGTLRRNESHAMLYDQAAAEDSFQHVRIFLAKWFSTVARRRIGKNGIAIDSRAMARFSHAHPSAKP